METRNCATRVSGPFRVMSISTPRIHFEAMEGREAERKQTFLKRDYLAENKSSTIITAILFLEKLNLIIYKF
jgi:hypothetical protein